MASTTFCGSAPAFWANTSSSPIATICAATMIWLAALAICPAPASPTWVIVLPIAWKTGRTFSSAACGPPTMIAKVPWRAPMSPPLTGASRHWTPFSPSFSAMRRAAAGWMVELSTKTSPGWAPSITPCGPSATSSTSGVSGRLVKTISTCAATSAGEWASCAPSATSSATAARLRLWTSSEKPALRMLRAIDLPIRPRPM